MLARFFDWLSKLQPRQLLMLSSGVAIFIFVLLYIALTVLVKEPELIDDNGEKPDSPAVTMQSVVVAARNIDEKVILQNEMLELKEFPEDSVPKGAITDVMEIVNKPTRAKIFKGDIITSQKVYSDISKAGFVYSIPENYRAVSIAVDDVTGVAGFAKAGDYVDVVLVEKSNDRATSRILLQNVLLLGVNKNVEKKDQQAPKPGEDVIEYANAAIDNPALATLALKPDEVLKLTSASKLGDIYLTLRPLNAENVGDGNTDYTVNSAKTIFQNNEPQIEIIYGNRN